MYKKRLKRFNPPIRGSIDDFKKDMDDAVKVSIPYKGFNRLYPERKSDWQRLYQSPYKGFNRSPTEKIMHVQPRSQSPYKGFNRTR